MATPVLFIRDAKLAGAGLGAVDVRLLVRARLAGAGLWTLDQALERAARRLTLS